MRAGSIAVTVGDLGVARAGGILSTVGVGSCVAIVLFDPHAEVGGLAHALLPDPSNGRHGASPGRYASTAVGVLLERMELEGASRGRAQAWLAGGASMFQELMTGGTRSVGTRNVAAARAALERAGVPIRGQDVGGVHGRSIFFPVAEGRVRITSVRYPDVLLC